MGCFVYRLLPFFVVGFVLAACADHPQTQADPAALAASDAAKCQSYGLQPDTPSYLKCLDKVADQRVQQETSERAGVAGRLLGQPPPWWK
jgi:hypothetical protein